MKNVLLILGLLLVSQVGFSQKSKKKETIETVAEVKQEPRKIVMQLATADTTAHKMLMKQLKNILSVAPDTEIEVVCHGPGLSMLVSEKTIVAKQIQEAAEKGVDFAACRFSMKERNVTDEQLIKQARIVEAGIIEIVDKQNAGWAYIKAGN
jgi:intracellular sulfur oxidation DsrE/DsrF family protein